MARLADDSVVQPVEAVHVRLPSVGQPRRGLLLESAHPSAAAAPRGERDVSAKFMNSIKESRLIRHLASAKKSEIHATEQREERLRKNAEWAPEMGGGASKPPPTPLQNAILKFDVDKV